MSAVIEIPSINIDTLEANLQGDDKNKSNKKESNWYAIGVLVCMALLTTGSLVFVLKYALNSNGKVWQFSVHAYEGPVRNIALSGPFFGKVRVEGTNNEISNSATENKRQSYCNGKPTIIPDAIKPLCYMMRIPSMYIGKIHSSWSVLGAQSVSLLIKHISLISIAFSEFIFADCYIRYRCLDHPTWKRNIRAVVLCVAIVACAFSIGFDLTNQETHKYENGIQLYAIGTISTGLFFWIVTLLIICYSQVDEVTNGDWHKHINLNMSFLVLLLLPLFMILGLLDHEKRVVDVHIQLIFFSSIFFAMLDIIEVRVMSVLQVMQVMEAEEDSDKLSMQLERIKIFVVLACILCKLFVFVPTLEMVGRYYITNDPSSFSWSMLALQIALLCCTSLVDLAHIGMWTRDIEWHSVSRTIVVWIIIGGSMIASALFPIKAATS